MGEGEECAPVMFYVKLGTFFFVVGCCTSCVYLFLRDSVLTSVCVCVCVCVYVYMCVYVCMCVEYCVSSKY